MTANSSRRMWCRAMWYLLLVSHILGFCYADDIIISVEKVVIKNLDCTYFDCDKFVYENEYNSEGVGCINSKWAIEKNLEEDTRVVISPYHCILDKCETPLGMGINETFNDFIKTKDVKLFFESGDIKISNDCNCIKKGTYVINQYCLDVDSFSSRVTGRYLVIFILYKELNNELMNVHIYVDSI